MKKKVKRKRKIRRYVKPKKPRKKVVFLIIDGLADLPMNNKTPLSEAVKPNLNYFARNGVLGEMIPVPKELWSDLTRASVSHLAAISLLGYDPKKYHVKRGPIEAVGTNIPYQEGHLAVRCNFATVDNEMKVLDRRAGRNILGLDELARYINEHVQLEVPHVFMRTYEHRAVLILKEKLSDKITNSDPYIAGEPVQRVQALSSDADRSAKLVQEFVEKAHQVIEYHPANELRIKHGLPPANFLLTREAGNVLPALSKQTFVKKYKLNKAVVIAENGVIKGVCMLAGFDAVTYSEMKPDQNLHFIFDNILSSLAEYDFVAAHIKWPDEPAHDGDFNRKQEMIELIDQRLGALKNFDGILVITCDHITSTKLRRHEYGPVPILVYGKKQRDKLEKFDEFSAKKGKLGLIRPKDLWKFVFSK